MFWWVDASEERQQHRAPKASRRRSATDQGSTAFAFPARAGIQETYVFMVTTASPNDLVAKTHQVGSGIKPTALAQFRLNAGRRAT